MTVRELYLPINPVPWTSPSVAFKTKRVYKAAELTAYQNAVKEQVLEAGIEPVELAPGARLELSFWFWRRLDSGTPGAGRKRRARQVDATNLQKALEDALQGVLFANDRDVHYIHSYVVEQGPDVTPGIGIWAFDTISHLPLSIPAHFQGVRAKAPVLPIFDEHDEKVEEVF
jgi:Holliday junction resolvase RusA-like endonuclease